MTTTSLDQVTAPRAVAGRSEATAVEQARAVAEVQAAVVVAQQVPRDTNKALQQMREACRQKALADRAFYSLPRAGGRVEGSTVHLARELARCWGNMQYGISELRRDDAAGESEMQAWAWDVETNTRSMRSFIVPHDRMVGKGAAKKRERLIDLGDISNNNNSVAARAVRETIFTVLPVWFRTEAEQIAAQTLQDGGGQTIEQQRAGAVAHFANSLRVTQQQLEARLERPMREWTAQDLAVLRIIDGEIGRGEKRGEDEFPAPTKAGVTAADITGKPTAADDVPDPRDGNDPWTKVDEPAGGAS